jgi:hypothetical protein
MLAEGVLAVAAAMAAEDGVLVRELRRQGYL